MGVYKKENYRFERTDDKLQTQFKCFGWAETQCNEKAMYLIQSKYPSPKDDGFIGRHRTASENKYKQRYKPSDGRYIYLT